VYSDVWVITSDPRYPRYNTLTHLVGSHRHCCHDQGWSTTCGGWRCTVAACPYVMPAVMVTIALVRRVPLTYYCNTAMRVHLRNA
jgi:hypothetical protein